MIHRFKMLTHSCISKFCFYSTMNDAISGWMIGLTTEQGSPYSIDISELSDFKVMIKGMMIIAFLISSGITDPTSP